MKERWVFTDAELENPSECNGNDFFIASVEDENVFVARNGKAMDMFSDFTQGVSNELRGLAEDVESLYDPENNCQADNWRDVLTDRQGTFLGFDEC